MTLITIVEILIFNNYSILSFIFRKEKATLIYQRKFVLNKITVVIYYISGKTFPKEILSPILAIPTLQIGRLVFLLQ